jgi:hypothetical protein
MNTNEVFDAMNDAIGGLMRRHDANEVDAGREPANVQMHDALAALLCSCFFKSASHGDLENNLRRAEEMLNKARSAANMQIYKELEAVATGAFKGTAFSR